MGFGSWDVFRMKKSFLFPNNRLFTLITPRKACSLELRLRHLAILVTSEFSLIYP